MLTFMLSIALLSFFEAKATVPSAQQAGHQRHQRFLFFRQSQYNTICSNPQVYSSAPVLRSGCQPSRVSAALGLLRPGAFLPEASRTRNTKQPSEQRPRSGACEALQPRSSYHLQAPGAPGTPSTPGVPAAAAPVPPPEPEPPAAVLPPGWARVSAASEKAAKGAPPFFGRCGCRTRHWVGPVWSKKKTACQGEFYYWNTDTNEVSWENPVQSPAGAELKDGVSLHPCLRAGFSLARLPRRRRLQRQRSSQSSRKSTGC